MPTMSLAVLIGVGAFGAVAWLMHRVTLKNWPLPVFMVGWPLDRPFRLAVTSSPRGCPRGLAAGDVLQVGRDGVLPRPLCVAVMSDVRSALDSAGSGPAEFSCDCPVLGKGIEFRVVVASPVD